MKGFLQYIPGNSILHQLSPITKLALSVLLCACAFLSSSILYISFLLLLVLGLSAMSGIGRSALQIFSLLLKLSLILFLAQIFFIREGDVLVRLPLNLFITDEGLAFAILIALRLMLSALPLALIITVTPMSDLAGAMVQKLRIPYKYAFALTTAIRFIPIFSTEISEIIEAQRARGVNFDTKNIFKKIRLILPLCLPLLVSSIKKTEYIALSAEMRGFALRNRKSGYKSYAFKGRDLIALLAGVFIIAASLLINLP